MITSLLHVAPVQVNPDSTVAQPYNRTILHVVMCPA